MFLLRHGQSEFNLHFTRTRRDPGIEDPSLTPEGHRQAHDAALALAGAGMTRIVVSPYTRALQTAAVAAEVLRVPVRVDPLVRERFAYACDVGTRRTQLAKDWPAHDFGAIDEIWWPKEPEPEYAVIARADQFRQAMRADPHAARTLLVSHWAFVLALTGRSIANGEWLSWDPMQATPHEIIWQH